MKNKDLVFDRSCHVLYSKQCEKAIKKRISLHYPKQERENVWTKVQLKYVDYLKDWRTDLGGKSSFHNGAGGTYDCIAIMTYYAVCKDVTGASSERVAECLKDKYFCIMPTSTVYCEGQKYVSKADEIRQVENWLNANGIIFIKNVL